MRGWSAARTAVMTAVAAIDADMRRMTRASAACRRLMTIPGGRPTDCARLCRRDRRSLLHSSVPRHRRLISAGSPSDISLARSTLHRQHLEMCDGQVRTLLYEAANVMLTRYKGQLKLKDQALRDRPVDQRRDAQSAGRSGSPARNHHVLCDAARWDGVRIDPSPRIPGDREAESGAPARSDARGREQIAASGSAARAVNQRLTAISTEPPCTQLTPSSAQRARERTQAPESVDTPKSPALDPLENKIGGFRPFSDRDATASLRNKRPFLDD